MTVALVGAGPGDPGLLTRRGAALLAVSFGPLTSAVALGQAAGAAGGEHRDGEDRARGEEERGAAAWTGPGPCRARRGTSICHAVTLI